MKEFEISIEGKEHSVDPEAVKKICKHFGEIPAQTEHLEMQTQKWENGTTFVGQKDAKGLKNGFGTIT